MIPAVLGLTAWIARGVAVAAIPRLLKVATELFSPPPQSATPEPCAPIRDNQAVFSFSDRCIVFEWDDDGRMTAIVDGTHRSEFGFDGYGRRIKIAEFDNGVITSKKLYWWLGGEIVTERDGLAAGFPIQKQYFGQGVIANGIKLFYTTDQLGSVRELIDSTGAVRADYRYTPYGERTKESGDLDSDWGYAGLWHHGPSGLDLATFRTYDSAQGRWISRDPLGEGAGYNLYAYCGNNPISRTDPSGLEPIFSNNPELGQAIQAVSALRPNWSTRVIANHDPTFFGRAAGLTEPSGWNSPSSHINVEALNRISDPSYRLFKYVETVAHELFHQNHPGAGTEGMFRTFGLRFLDYWVKNVNKNQTLKSKYKLYKTIREFDKVEDQWSGDCPAEDHKNALSNAYDTATWVENAPNLPSDFPVP